MTGLLSRCRLAALAVAILAACAWGVRAEEDQTAQVEKLFREGVDLYQQGQYSAAQRRLREVLALDPRKELAARLVDEAGVKIMAQMMADVRMGNEPTRVWDLYRKYYLGKLADKERMAKMAARLVDPNTSEEERAGLCREFAQLSHYAVPSLAGYLKDATHEDYRTYARIALAGMGPRAVLPVIALLDSKDQLMRENAILTLEEIRPLDPRAIPALKARLEDPKESATAKGFAVRVLAKMTGLQEAAWKPAAQYYYDQANRYFLERPGVAEEAEDVDGMVWHLNAEGDLVSVQYPLWAWNDQMAEETVLHGLAIAPEYTPFYPLWACVQAGEFSEVKELLDILNEQPARTTFSEEEKKEVQEWDKKLVNARRLIAAVGKEHCNEALGKVLSDLRRYPSHSRLPGIGAVLARELAALDPRGNLLEGPKAPGQPAASKAAPKESWFRRFFARTKRLFSRHPFAKEKKKEVIPSLWDASSALVAGLDCADQSVQYACAISLAAINRFPMEWLGSGKVAGILGRGLSESKPLQILLVEEDPNATNEMRGRLQTLGYGVTSSSSARDALVAARSFPPKDLAVVAGNLRRDLTAEQLLAELKADARTRVLPIGILMPRADRNAVQARFGANAVQVEREFSGNDLKTVVEKLAEQRIAESLTKRQAHEMSVACGQALIGVDAQATHLHLNDAVPHAILALVKRQDDVRSPAAIFLGMVEGGGQKAPAAEKLKAVALDTNSALEVRCNAMRSLGRVQKEGLEELYLKAQSDPEQKIKDVAAEAFGQRTRANKITLEFISSQRIDKERKEK